VAATRSKRSPSPLVPIGGASERRGARRFRRAQHGYPEQVKVRQRAAEVTDDVSARLEDRYERGKARLPQSLQRLIEEARGTDLLLFAGGLAFYGLISLAPFVVIGFWIAGGIVGEDGLEELGENLDEIAPGGANISNLVDSLAAVGTGVGIGALIAALWPATAYGGGLVRAFDRISHRPDRAAQGLRGRAKALLFLILLPLFVLGALGASYFGAALFDDGPSFVVLGWLLALVAGFTAGFVTLGIIYVVFGPDHLQWSAVAQGAAAASGAIAVMSLGYVIYLGQGADFEEQVAGTGLAALVLLALWLYLANAIMLTGYSLARSCSGETDDVENVE
jgi:membrane protein